MTDNPWARLLAYVTGLINQELLLKNQYLAARRCAYAPRNQTPADRHVSRRKKLSSGSTGTALRYGPRSVPHGGPGRSCRLAAELLFRTLAAHRGTAAGPRHRKRIVYGPDIKEIARHELFPSGITGQKRTLPEHSPGRDLQQKRELLKQRFEEFGPNGILFFDQLLRSRHHGKDEAVRVLQLLAVYRREDLARALERAVRYRAFSWSAVERIVAAQARPRSGMESLAIEAQQHLDEILQQAPLSPRSTAEYQLLLEETAHRNEDENINEDDDGNGSVA